MPPKRPYPWIAPGDPIEGLERSAPSRTVNSRICILPEGENEAHYFRGLINEVRALSVVVDDVRGVPKTLITRAQEIQQMNQRAISRGEPPDYDQIWCVSDGGDDHPNVPEALAREARQSRIRVAISMPCFEVWQLLHFEELTTRPIESAAAAKRLMREKHVPGFGRTRNVVPYSESDSKRCI